VPPLLVSVPPLLVSFPPLLVVPPLLAVLVLEPPAPVVELAAPSELLLPSLDPQAVRLASSKHPASRSALAQRRIGLGCSRLVFPAPRHTQ